MTSTTPKRWTPRKESVCKAIAFTDKSYRQIAAEHGISERAIWRWLTREPFKARLERYQAEFSRAVRSQGMAILAQRVALQQQVIDGLKRIMEARAAWYARQAKTPQPDGSPGLDVPGADTGLIAREIRRVTKDGREIYAYRLDDGWLNTMLAYQERIAKELGQWVERLNVDTTTKLYSVIGPDEL